MCVCMHVCVHVCMCVCRVVGACMIPQNSVTQLTHKPIWTKSQITHFRPSQSAWSGIGRCQSRGRGMGSWAPCTHRDHCTIPAQRCGWPPSHWSGKTPAACSDITNRSKWVTKQASERVTSQPVIQSVSQWFGLRAIQPVSQPVRDSVPQPASQWFSQSEIQSVSQLVVQSISQPVSDSFSQLVIQAANQSVLQSAHQRFSPPASQRFS